jgi:hypothetical protein
VASKHHFYDLLSFGELQASDSTPRKFFNLPNSGGCLMAYGTAVPSAVSGYALGCLFLHTDGSASTAVYRNVGSSTSCTFVELGTLDNAGTTLNAFSTNITTYTNVASTNNPAMTFRSSTTNAATPFGWVPAFKVGSVQHYVLSCTSPNP